jgi:hypothetical protein
MNLREQLRHILPEILPANAAEAIKGTELIRLVRYRLGDEYSDATLRYHFSILSYDPSSPIAKVDQGQGYFLRLRRAAHAGSNGRSSLFESGAEGSALRRRYLRVRAIVERLQLQNQQYPFVLNGRAEEPLVLDGDWELPDLVCADWDVETGADEQPRFDEAMLSLRRHLGAPEVGIAGITIKIGVADETFPAGFFQALSATRWTTRGELIIAESITDEAFVDSLRSLGQQFGVGITTLGIDLAKLDDLRDADDILGMTSAEFEAMQGELHIRRITAATQRSTLDWATLSNLRKKHSSINEFVKWLSECLDKRMPVK